MILRKTQLLRIGNLIALIITIGVNVIANALPLNGQTTGEVSDKFDTLFTPADYTFSIWTIIYLGLIGFIIYQFKPRLINKSKGEKDGEAVVSSLSVYFISSCVFNIAWIFSWHYQYLFLTLVFILSLLITLIVINKRLIAISNRIMPSSRFTWMARVPFGIYVGWVSVAFIANIAVYLTSINWGGLGIEETYWTIIVIVAAALIALYQVGRLNLISAGSAILWGLFGVYIQLWRNNHSWALQVVSIIVIAIIFIGIARAVRNRSNLTEI